MEADLRTIGGEGYLIRSVRARGRRATVIAANTDIGVLHGAFHFLRLLQTQQRIDALTITERPRIQLRMLNHWDNLDRQRRARVRRRFALGLAQAARLHVAALPRLRARERLDRHQRHGADQRQRQRHESHGGVPRKGRPRSPTCFVRTASVSISPRASARRSRSAGCKTADPLDPAVRAWWKTKIDEIYNVDPGLRRLPREGQLRRTAGTAGLQAHARRRRQHAGRRGSQPHGGIVMWRAFVYSNDVHGRSHTQAYDEFKPLDGTFRDERARAGEERRRSTSSRASRSSPLFGAMPKTPLMMEFQITKEYLGQETHLSYLAPLFEEVLGADTFAQGRRLDGPTGHRRIAARLRAHRDRRCREHRHRSQLDRVALHQANWYAFGRLAWNPSLASADRRRVDAHDVHERRRVRRTGEVDDARVARSRRELHDAARAASHHGARPSLRAGAVGERRRARRLDVRLLPSRRHDRHRLRSHRHGSNAVSQYAAPVRERFANRKTVPDDYLLWFHRVRWDYRMASGRTLWDELTFRYCRGVDTVRGMQKTWQGLSTFVDRERFEETRAFLAIQEKRSALVA